MVPQYDEYEQPQEYDDEQTMSDFEVWYSDQEGDYEQEEQRYLQELEESMKELRLCSFFLGSDANFWPAHQ